MRDGRRQRNGVRSVLAADGKSVMMNDREIRKAYHRSCLRRFHADSSTLVIDELGLRHGRCRADIAVVNGQLNGYEIKSDVDSLRRLDAQIDGYNAVFDRVSMIATARQLRDVINLVPAWWGIISVTQGPHGGIHFRSVRRSLRNDYVDDFAVAQLLWRGEAQRILVSLGVEGKPLRAVRADLYGYLVDRLDSGELRRTVRAELKSRRNWRRPALPSQGDG